MYEANGQQSIQNQENFKGVGQTKEKFRPEGAQGSGAENPDHLWYKWNWNIFRRGTKNPTRGRKQKEATTFTRRKTKQKKRKALWLEAGDRDTKFFHKCASHRKNINTILEIKDEEGGTIKQFKEKTKDAVDHFRK